MLETYLTIKTFIMLFGLAFLLLSFILCGIAIIQAAVEHYKFQKTMKQIISDGRNKKKNTR